jgi:hypothetical protein
LNNSHKIYFALFLFIEGMPLTKDDKKLALSLKN